MAEFLLEIGLEEVPARMIAGAQAELHRRVIRLLREQKLLEDDVFTLLAEDHVLIGKDSDLTKSFSTPRRLAVWVRGVIERQEDVVEEVLRPSAKIAFKDGVPTPAAIAFAKKSGVEVEALATVTTPKGEYLQAKQVKPGRTAAEVLAAELPKELAAIYWAKNMRWRPGKADRFVRPVRWIVALLDSTVVPVEFAGYTASNLTYGHRVLFGPQEIVLTSPSAYEESLKQAFVLVDVEQRRQTIRKALDHATRTVESLRWREDHALVDGLTHLVEWASDRAVVLGGFEPEFLALPEEVLVTVMRDHQKYFALEGVDGKLAPHFLAVLNIESDDAGLEVIRHGNARVLRARFNDARFFWEFDQRTPLAERVKLLENVTFQKDLGSYAAKAERVRKVAAALAGHLEQRGTSLDARALDEAALFAKTDLTTELVKEFTELQGIVGGLYARAQGISEAAAAAIYDQYLPESMEDRVPRTIEGAVLSIADKADTIAGMFGLGLEPTGSKDPFALRRAANGIVKILAEAVPALPLTLADVIAASGASEAVAAKLQAFFAERVEFYLKEIKGQAYDVVKAVLASGTDDIRDAIVRAEAVTAVRGSEDFAAVSAAFKRIKNILSQAAEKGIAVPAQVDAAKLIDPAEQALNARSAELAAKVAELRQQKSYIAALEAIATLRAPVDAFFDTVMVMAPDEAVRGNRLALLSRVLGDFSEIADFSEIVTAG